MGITRTSQRPAAVQDAGEALFLVVLVKYMICIHYNIYLVRICTLNAAFSEPQSLWPSPPPPPRPRPPSANGGAPGARREFPLGAAPPISPHPGKIGRHSLGSVILPYISTTPTSPGRKPSYSGFTPPRTGVETPIPSAGR